MNAQGDKRKTRRWVCALGLVLVVAGVLSYVVAVQLRPEHGSSATITASSGRPWRPATAPSPGYANTKIPASPEISRTETSVVRRLSDAFLNIEAYAEPVYFAPVGTPLRAVRCIRYGCVGGTSAPITGREVVASGSDGQLVIVDTERRRSYELYRVARDPDGSVRLGSDGTVTAGSMSVVDVDGRGNKTAGGEKLNITGAGLSRLFGVIRAPEVDAAATDPEGAIPHALQVSLPVTANCAGAFRVPATKSDGRVRAGPCVEQGARLQLDPTFDCTQMKVPLARAVCHALQTYGAFVIDNNGGTGMGLFGQHVASWAEGQRDYRSAGIEGDYRTLDLPMERLRVLSRWDGH